MRIYVVGSDRLHYDAISSPSYGQGKFKYKKASGHVQGEEGILRVYEKGLLLFESSGHMKRVSRATHKQRWYSLLPWAADLCMHEVVGPHGTPPSVSMKSRPFTWGFGKKASEIDAKYLGESQTSCSSSHFIPRTFKLLVGSGFVFGGVALVITGLFTSKIIMFTGVGGAGAGLLWFALLIVRNQTTGRGLPICGARVGDLVYGLRYTHLT